MPSVDLFKELIPKWVVKTLKENNNCYINHKLRIPLEVLAEVVGFELTIRSVVDGKGWVIERKQ